MRMAYDFSMMLSVIELRIYPIFKQQLLLSCSDYLFKLLLIGDSGVGKSCLLLRFAVSVQRSTTDSQFFFLPFLVLNYAVKFTRIY